MNDGRIKLASLLAIGFIGLIGAAMFATITEGSQRIVDGSLGALGAALVNAITGIFRNDKADEQRALNTGSALNAISDAIKATPGNPPDDPVNVAPVEPK